MATHPRCIYNVTYQLVCFSGSYFADPTMVSMEGANWGPRITLTATVAY